MTLPLSSYQKIFDSFILGSFPDIKYLEVNSLPHLYHPKAGIQVIFYLRPLNELTSSLSCNELLEVLRVEVGELLKYLGSKIMVDMSIYSGEQFLCRNLFGY